MEKLYVVLIEVAIFLLLGLAYYLYQKRKILKNDYENNCNELYDLLEKYNQDMDAIAELMRGKKIQEILDATNKVNFTAEDIEDAQRLKHNLEYHLKH